VHTKRLTPKLSPEQLFILRARADSKTLAGALVRATELGLFGTPDPDRVSRTFTYNSSTLNTAVKFAFRGARWLPGRLGQGADPVCQDSIAEALAYASEHADGISPEFFVDFIFNGAATRFGNAELRELAVQTGNVGVVDFHLDRYAQRYTHLKVVQELDSRPRFGIGSGYGC
jgi:hypothetical protein